MTKSKEENNKIYSFFKVGLYAVLALPILAISPWFYPADWGKNIIFRSIIAILLFLFVWLFFYKRNSFNFSQLKNNIIFWFLATFIGIYFIASIFSLDPLFSFWGSPYRGGGFVNLLFYFIFALITFLFLKTEDWGKLWKLSFIVGALVSLIALFQYFGLFSNFFVSAAQRPSSTMGNTIALAIYLLLLCFSVLSFAINESVKWKKVLYFLCLTLFLCTILITETRAVYLGIAVAGIYFFLFYPKKAKYLKIISAGILIVAALAVFYVNTIAKYPDFVQKNRLLNSITQRLSLNLFIQDPRVGALPIELNIVKSRPLLGYGPENFSIGFDKFFIPSIPALNRDVGWWDRAHNVLIQTMSDAGFFSLLIYLGLFIALLFSLQRKKKLTEENNQKVFIHTLQATLIGYFVSMLFSFDSFGTYIIFFLIVGNSMFLTCNQSTEEKITEPKTTWWKAPTITFLALILVIFLWQYNLVPLKINADINSAGVLAENKKCDQAFSLMDKTLNNTTFLDSYSRMQYAELTITCNKFYPKNNLSYIKKDFEIIKEAAKTRTYYSRYWIALGDYSSTIAAQETNTDLKKSLLKDVENYLNKASELAPNHQEVTIAKAKMEMAKQDYKKMQEYSEKCIALYDKLNDCYWYLGLSKIYQKQQNQGQKDIETAGKNGYYINSEENLNVLANAYGAISDYKNLAEVFEKLANINPNNAQYHSTLAFCYKQLGKYSDARKEALIVLQLSPQSKANVDAFLNSLP